MDQVKKLITNIPKPFKNKYLLTLILFSLWIIFIDDYNLIRQYQLQQDIEKLKEQKSYYLSEIKKDSTELKLLENDKEEQERFAREKFLMKRENEDVFIIREKYNE
tara:strand:- start:20 stop:337 length:318 start_codon:yes stop_codon:yes gene_type:complete